MKKIITSIVLMSGLISGAFAENATTNMNASASIQNSCTISVDDIGFGVLDWLQPGIFVRAAGEARVFCNKDTAYMTYPEQVFENGASHVLRSETGTEVISYNFARDVDFKRWNRQNPIQSVGDATSQNYLIYAEILKTSNPQTYVPEATNNKNNLARPGNYQGTVKVNVDY